MSNPATTLPASQSRTAPEGAVGYCTTSPNGARSADPTSADRGEPLGDPGGPFVPSLGIITNSCHNADLTGIFHRLEKWSLQAAIREIFPDSRTANCLRTVSKYAGPSAIRGDNFYSLDFYRNVEVVKSGDRFHYGNLMTCGSVWACPICATKISEHRRVELVQAVKTWKDAGCNVELLTLTAPHYSNQKLSFVRSGITKALRYLTKSRGWQALAKEIGLHGRIRSLEVTYGENGWHPHFHILLFRYANRPLVNVEARILDLWQTACLKSSLPVPNQHGVSLDNGELAAQYVGKWGLEHEMTKGHIKKARGGYSPFDLLRVFIGNEPGGFLDHDPLRAAVLFREYAKAFKGKRQLVWSDGLRADLLAGLEMSDEEIAQSVDQDAELFALVPVSTWKLVLRKKHRGVLLEICKQGKAALAEYLNSLTQHEHHQ